MKTERPAKELVVSAEDRKRLESIARSQSLPAALVRRAQMILRMADGEVEQRGGATFSREPAHRYPVAHPLSRARHQRPA